MCKFSLDGVHSKQNCYSFFFFFERRVLDCLWHKIRLKMGTRDASLSLQSNEKLMMFREETEHSGSFKHKITNWRSEVWILETCDSQNSHYCDYRDWLQLSDGKTKLSVTSCPSLWKWDVLSGSHACEIGSLVFSNLFKVMGPRRVPACTKVPWTGLQPGRSRSYWRIS